MIYDALCITVVNYPHMSLSDTPQVTHTHPRARARARTNEHACKDTHAHNTVTVFHKTQYAPKTNIYVYG